MNKVYKLVWSKVRSCYVAVSEMAKSRTKAPKSGVFSSTLVAGVLVFVLSCGAVLPVYADNYTAGGGSVVYSMTDGIAIGTGAKIGYTSSDGTTSSLGHDGAIAIGKNAHSYFSKDIAIGIDSNSYGQGSVALGRLAEAGTFENGSSSSIAIGQAAKAKGSSAVAIGQSAAASEYTSVAIGDNAKASGKTSIAIGQNAAGSKDNTIALGLSATASVGNSLALGYYTKSTAANSVSLGYYANASAANSIALGANSVADVKDTVSVGSSTLKRRIMNVANGTADNDAVNYNQLKPTIKSLSVSGRTITYTKVDGTTGTITTQDNDTHYTSHLYVGSGTAANAATTNGNTKLTLTDNSTVREKVTVKGTGATTVTSDANGVITINSTNTTYSTGNATTAGIGKLYAESGTNTDGSMTQKAINTALGGKYNTSGGILTGNVTISKSAPALVTKNTALTRGTAPTAANNNWFVQGQDSAAKNTGGLYKTVSTTNVSEMRLYDYPNKDNTSGGHYISIGHDADGNAFTYAPTPAASSNNTNIATTAFVKTEVRPTADGTFAKKANSTAANITALDTAAKNAIKGLSVNGKVITYTKGDGTTGTITTQDTDTTYSAFKGATADAAGGAGLVTAPAKGQQNYVLHGDGTWKADANTTYAAMTAAEATTGTATTARSITAKVLGDYVKSQTNDKITNLTVSGKTITFIKGDGTTGTITTQDTDTKYTAGSGLALSGTTFSVNANGAIASGNANPLKGGTVFTEVRPTADGSFIKKANTTAANLTALDGAAKNAIKNLSVNGKVITYTKGDGTTGTITTQDDDTVYTAGSGLKLEDNVFLVDTSGAIETSNTGVLKGGTVYNEVRPDQNGIFVKSANTVGQNLLALDSELSGVKNRMDDAVIYDGANHAKATLTGGTAGTTLDNVRAGLISKTSKQAINGGQLYDVKMDIEGFAEDIRRNTNSIQTLNSSVSNALASVAAANTLVNTVNDLKADASLNNLSAAGKQVISNAAIDAVQQYIASQEADANTSSLNTLNRTMKTNKRVDGLSLSLMSSPGADANYVVYDDAEASQITLEDASGEGTKVTNVAEGSLSAASSDAVNGAQLYKTNQNLAALQDTISLNNGTIASLQTDSQKVKTDMLTLQSQYATTKNQVETGFNVTVNGAKVKTVDPDSAYIDFVAGDGIDITADNGSVKISSSVHADGQVALDDVNAVSGDTVYQEVRPATDGNYIKTADTTSANLTSLDTALNTEVSERSSAVMALQEADTALSTRIGVLSEDGDYVRKDASVSANLFNLDEALYDKVDYDAANIGKNYDGSSSEKEFNARQWGEALGTGNIEGGDSRLVTGDTVNVEVRPAYDGEYVKVNSSVGNNLLSLDEHVLANRDDIDSHSQAISGLKDLSNISDSGKEVIKELAADAVDVTGSDTVSVEKSTIDGVNYFKVSAKVDGSVAYNNKGLVTGGKLFEELRPVDDGSFVEGRNSVATNLIALDSQIKANKDAIAELAGAPSVDLSDMVRYDSYEHSKVTLDGSSVGTTLTNVRSGVISKTSKDAVNGSQLWAVKQDIEGFAEDIRRNSNNIQTLNGSVSNALSSVAAANTLVNTVNDLKADASLNNLSAAGKQVIANAAMDAVQQYMADKSSVDPSANLNSNYYTINVADLIDDFSGNDNLGDFKQNRNDSLLTTSLRKVNSADASTNYVVYDDADSSAITLEGADGTKVSNVADGMLSADSKDAVNGKQLFETNTRVDVLDSKLKTVSDDVGSLRTDVDGLQADMDGLKTGLDDLQVDIGGKADSNLTNISDEGKDVVRGLAKKSLNVSSGKYVTVDKQDVDGVDDYHINVVVDGEVADGNDGIVTGGKVFEALSHIDVSDERIRNVVKEDLAGKADKDLSNLSDNGKDVIRDVVKPDLDRKADVNASNIDVAAWSDKLGVGNVAEGDNGLVKGGAVYEAIKDIRSNDLMAVDEYSIRLGGNAKYDAYDVVDVSKSDGSGRVMTGIVVNPDDPNSAVNVSYVDALGQNIINGVNDGLRKVDDKINKVGAGAAAMASLAPLPFDDDQKWNVSAAVGTYKGEQSGAVGVFFKPQDNVMLNLRGSFGNGENMGGAGVTVGLNKGAAHGLSKVAMAKAMNAQAVEIVNQKQLIVSQQEQLDVARAEIEELKALVNTVVSNADKG